MDISSVRSMGTSVAMVMDISRARAMVIYG